jgi:hypothetical protein
LGSTQGPPKAVAIEGLEQVTAGVNFERLHGVAFATVDQNDRGWAVCFQLPEDLETAQLRHLDVQKQQVRCPVADQVDRVSTGTRFPDELDGRLVLQQSSQELTGAHLIVHDHGTHGGETPQLVGFDTA